MAEKDKKDLDSKLEAREERVPELALEAFREAFEKARKSGHPVVVAEGEHLVAIRPDGSREVVKRIPAKVKLRPSTQASAT